MCNETAFGQDPKSACVYAQKDEDKEKIRTKNNASNLGTKCVDK